jgi:diamine N-acetyltransferase
VGVQETSAYRLWLDVLVDNHRARQVYEAAGFVDEGLLRQAYRLPDDSRIDLVLMALLRPEWTRARDANRKNAAIAV